MSLIGDLPIFVAHDSADVWSRPDLFHLSGDGRPTVVAGVPPDYFAATGQRWGNPLYDWEAHRSESYQWWADRLRATFARFDMVRIDHFRGFVSFWEIPAHEPTAVNGRWVKGPGLELFTALESRIGSMAIIAEDLGIITDEVTDLRRLLGFPGMRVAQFGFDEESNTAIHHPSNYPPDVVAYTGTHDNDTTVGWFWGADQRHDRRRLNRNRRRLLALAGSRGQDINWDLIRIVFESAADTAVVPVQDLLGLGSEARMNTPGREEGNWIWRMTNRLSPELSERLQQMTARPDADRDEEASTTGHDAGDDPIDTETELGSRQLHGVRRPAEPPRTRIDRPDQPSRSRGHRRPRLRTRAFHRSAGAALAQRQGRWNRRLRGDAAEGRISIPLPSLADDRMASRRDRTMGSTTSRLHPVQQCRAALAGEPSDPFPAAAGDHQARGSVRRSDAGQLGPAFSPTHRPPGW